jgi:hypothetical protein
MRQASRWTAALAVSFVAFAGTGRAATQEKIGSWVLSCAAGAPGSEACLMRTSTRFFEKAGITGDLEIDAQGKFLVPVIALRGLSNEMLMTAASMGGKADASIQFGGDPPEALNCSASNAGYFCSPSGAAVQKLATALQAARSVTVRVTVSMAGLNPLPSQEKSLDLSGTKEALARLRTAGPSRVPSPMTASAPQSPGAMMAMADRALKAAGYQNGMADLQAMMAKYSKK